MIPVNLFRVRATEHIEDAEFLRLFGVSALDIFEPGEIWSRMQIIRSSRGGGKTSVLRIFSPRTLNKIKNQTGGLKPLVDKLVDLGVLSANYDINVLGIYLRLRIENYPILENIDLEPTRQKMLFFALLTSKIVMSTLHGVCELKKVDLEDGLRHISVGRPDESIPVCVPVPCDGEQLYKWASDIESHVHSVTGGNNSHKNMAGYETLSVVRLIQHSNIYYDGKRVASKTLLMLDDVDSLANTQRKDLAWALADLRVPSIWMAERLEALRPEELLSINGTEEREWGAPLILERFWRGKKRRKRFISLLEAIANQRADPQTENLGFRSMFMNDVGSNLQFKNAIQKESQRLDDKFGKTPEYKKWLDNARNSDATLAEQASGWRLLEINIERSQRSKQKTLPNVALSEDMLQRSSDIKHVSDFYIRKKYEIPYYYGFENLARMASSNILQFLNLASDFFDERTNARIAGEPDEIQPKRQEEILEKAAERYWDNVSRIVKAPVLDFVDTVARFCAIETNLPNSPYSSVTGIAISKSDLEYLQNPQSYKARSEHVRIVEILSQCFAHNILSPRMDSRQGPSGTLHLVMYLNRLLCVRYNLPLAYGGWRKKSLTELADFSRNIVKTRKTITARKRSGARGGAPRTKNANVDPAQRDLEIDHA